jgi:hypothetical protein
MNRREMKKMEQWAAKQSMSMKFKLVDREPGEPPATKRQIEYIRHLVRSIDEKQLMKLGKWQASALIDEIKNAKEQFTEQKVKEYTKRKGIGCGTVLLVIIGLAVLAALFSGKDSSHETSQQPTAQPSPRPSRNNDSQTTPSTESKTEDTPSSGSNPPRNPQQPPKVAPVFDLEKLAARPDLWPKELVLVAPVITTNRYGSIQLSKGLVVRLAKVAIDGLYISHAGETNFVPVNCTDIERQVDRKQLIR